MIKDSSMIYRRPYKSKTIKPKHRLSKEDKAILIVGAIVLAFSIGFLTGLVIGADHGYEKGLQTVTKE